MKKIFLLCLSVLVCFVGNAQIEGLSLNISPSAKYEVMGGKSGLSNGPIYEGKLGLSFGKNLELRGVYSFSNALKRDASKFSFPNSSNTSLSDEDITLRRLGGELKLNIGSSKVAPYILVGSGIQDLHLKSTPKEQQIYIGLGAGMKLKATDKFGFGIEAKTTRYNFNANQSLITNAEKQQFGIVASDYQSSVVGNWSIGVNMEYYIGKSRSQATDFDSSYLAVLKGRSSGVKWVIEPFVGRLDFDRSLQYRETRLVGFNTGLNLGRYVGLRGFYWQAVNSENLSDKLAMYGGELVTHFANKGNATPYIILGFGETKIASNYVTRDSMPAPSKKPFATLGAGLKIDITPNITVFGNARSIIVASENIEEVGSPSQISKSGMYTVGFGFKLGKARKNKAKPVIIPPVVNEAPQKELDEPSTNNEIVESTVTTTELISILKSLDGFNLPKTATILSKPDTSASTEQLRAEIEQLKLKLEALQLELKAIELGVSTDKRLAKIEDDILELKKGISELVPIDNSTIEDTERE